MDRRVRVVLQVGLASWVLFAGAAVGGADEPVVEKPVEPPVQHPVGEQPATDVRGTSHDAKDASTEDKLRFYDVRDLQQDAWEALSRIKAAVKSGASAFEERNGILIVRAPHAYHEDLERTLKQLRKQFDPVVKAKGDPIWFPMRVQPSSDHHPKHARNPLEATRERIRAVERELMRAVARGGRHDSPQIVRLREQLVELRAREMDLVGGDLPTSQIVAPPSTPTWRPVGEFTPPVVRRAPSGSTRKGDRLTELYEVLRRLRALGLEDAAKHVEREVGKTIRERHVRAQRQSPKVSRSEIDALRDEVAALRQQITELMRIVKDR